MLIFALVKNYYDGETETTNHLAFYLNEEKAMNTKAELESSGNYEGYLTLDVFEVEVQE